MQSAHQGKNLAVCPRGFLCPRRFAIPESLTADILSARVADPHLSPCGLQIHRDTQTDAEDIKTCATPCVFPVGVDLVSARPVHSGLRQAKPLQRMVLHGSRGFANPQGQGDKVSKYMITHPLKVLQGDSR